MDRSLATDDRVRITVSADLAASSASVMSALSSLCEAAVLQARIPSAMAEEVSARRPYWIAGVPTELDLAAARKAVARRLKVTPETVVAVLAMPVPLSEELPK